MYSGTFYLTEARQSLGQNEMDSHNLTYIPACLFWKVIFLLIINFLKADVHEIKSRFCNLQNGSTLCQNAPPSPSATWSVPLLALHTVWYWF